MQERIQQNSEEFLISLQRSEEYSKTRNPRVIATVSPFTNATKFESRTAVSESFGEKLLFDADRLQESGIFDEFSEHELIESKSTETQTDSANLIFFGPAGRDGMSNIGGGSSGLVDELNKLETIKQRIEERGPLFGSAKETNFRDYVRKAPVITLSKELAYFKKQCDILKNRLAAYELSGDARVKQLAQKLQRENELQKCVEYLTKKMAKMEKEMKRLEEEKCEYEEAENDTRLRSQK